MFIYVSLSFSGVSDIELELFLTQFHCAFLLYVSLDNDTLARIIGEGWYLTTHV